MGFVYTKAKKTGLTPEEKEITLKWAKEKKNMVYVQLDERDIYG